MVLIVSFATFFSWLYMVHMLSLCILRIFFFLLVSFLVMVQDKYVDVHELHGIYEHDSFSFFIITYGWRCLPTTRACSSFRLAIGSFVLLFCRNFHSRSLVYRRDSYGICCSVSKGMRGQWSNGQGKQKISTPAPPPSPPPRPPFLHSCLSFFRLID